MSHPGRWGGGQEALFHLVVRLHSVISKSQKLGGGGCVTEVRLRLMRFLSKRFTAGVFRSAHQSKPLRARTAAKQSVR